MHETNITNRIRSSSRIRKKIDTFAKLYRSEYISFLSDI